MYILINCDNTLAGSGKFICNTSIISNKEANYVYESIAAMYHY